LSGREEAREMATCSSLRLYSELSLKQPCIPQYINDRSNVQGVRLLTKCRMGYLYLMGRVAKAASAEVVSPLCPLCHHAVMEDVEHFLLDCPAMEPCRRQLDSRLQQVLPELGPPGAELWDRYSGSREGRLRVRLGDLEVHHVPQEDPDVDELLRGQAGRARYYTDKTVKNFLVACWRVRECLVGVQTVVAGHLLSTPSSRSLVELYESQLELKELEGPELRTGTQSFWTEWNPKAMPEEKLTWPKRKGPSAFYAVKCGRTPGMFYKWSDCRRSVAGKVDSVFRGHLSLGAAEEWLLDG
jgi:hypothetical protein